MTPSLRQLSNTNVSGLEPSAGYGVPEATGTQETVDPLAFAALRDANVTSQFAQHVQEAEVALLADVVARKFSLTVGAVGQKHFLTALSRMRDPAGHDAALRTVLVRACRSLDLDKNIINVLITATPFFVWQVTCSCLWGCR